LHRQTIEKSVQHFTGDICLPQLAADCGRFIG